MRLLLVPVLPLLCVPTIAGAPSADAAWTKGDYRGAFAQAIEPAIRGNAHAQFLIGEAYRLGRSVDPNFPVAEQWYARAARQGDVAAATQLGLLLVGQHLESAALPWLVLAARAGEPRALCSLAAIYFNGDGVDRDEARAFALMSRAAASGLPEAQARLATLRGLLSPDVQAKGLALRDSALPSPQLPPETVYSADQDGAATRATVRVQVGAYRSAAAAERAWTLLAGQVDGLGTTDHAIVKAGALFRLEARLPDSGTAADLCRRLRAAGRQHFTRQGLVRA